MKKKGKKYQIVFSNGDKLIYREPIMKEIKEDMMKGLDGQFYGLTFINFHQIAYISFYFDDGTLDQEKP